MKSGAKYCSFWLSEAIRHVRGYASISRKRVLRNSSAINAVRSTTLPARECSERRGHSKTQKVEHPSSSRLLDTESLRPNRILFECSNPALAEVEFCLRDSSVPRTRRASGPRTGARGRLQFLRACCHLVAASPLRGSAPTPRARASFGRCAVPTVAELRRPPADKLVKSETEARLGVERRPRHRTPSRTPRNFLPRS